MSLPNVLSLCRLPLALVFLQPDPLLRFIGILAAMLTDWMDGFLARRYQTHSQLGALLDPLTDKFFVIFALTFLYLENPIPAWQIIAMLSRDIAVILFGFYLLFTGSFFTYQLRSIWCGKVTTVIQLFILIAWTFHQTVPNGTFLAIITLGILALVELIRGKDEPLRC